MRRREFIRLVSGAAAAWPLAARAQNREPVRRIGMLIAGSESDAEALRRISVLLQALAGLGWVTERNIRVDYRWATSGVERFRTLAQELVDLNPDLLIAISATQAALAFKQATNVIPILFINLTDPVGSKLVETLAHPNGNATGFTNFEYDMVGKWLEFLREAAPQVVRVSLLFNPVSIVHVQAFIRILEQAAQRLSTELLSAPVNDASDIARTIELLERTPGNGLIVVNEAFTSVNRKQIIGLANQYKVPAIYPFRFFATDGGLLSYGVDQIEIFRRSANYIDRILKGEKPTNLPVQQPTKFELVINLRTAKALGLTVPPMLLSQADEVIE
jgi:putative ABC transport system substrate-binding protein